ncbi:MAG: D-alanine--poly(phosphoribitol) ligase, partial [Eubacterium sp.]|nr:D-alanine--poly(phosphoribitol) ligase [Eubacterium sp.]
AIDGVERCVCIFDEQKSKLKGFYVGTIEKVELLSIMRNTLPVFMIPNMIRQIEEMPLTKNGKVDRKKLNEMGRR